MKVFLARCLGWLVYPLSDLLRWLDPDLLHLTTNYKSGTAGTNVIHASLPPTSVAPGAQIEYVLDRHGKPQRDRQGRLMIK